MSQGQPLHPGLNLGHTHGEAHKATEVVAFGFWVFLMSDLITFGLFFATFGTMANGAAGGPVARDFVDLASIAGQTALLLTSTLTFGFASLALKYHASRRALLGWLGLTALLGAGFVALEVRDFIGMAAAGAVPQRSGYLSAFWSLVGLHGLHVSAGIIWIGVMAAQITTLGLTDVVKSRIVRLGLYWHFLDIVWVAIMSFVFLAGVV